MRHIRVAIVTVEKQYSERVCSLGYPGSKAHAPYYIVIYWPRQLHHIFRYYLINGTIFGKEILLNIK